jgi:hypothetical protein
MIKFIWLSAKMVHLRNYSAFAREGWGRTLFVIAVVCRGEDEGVAAAAERAGGGHVNEIGLGAAVPAHRCHGPDVPPDLRTRERQPDTRFLHALSAFSGRSDKPYCHCVQRHQQ